MSVLAPRFIRFNRVSLTILWTVACLLLAAPPSAEGSVCRGALIAPSEHAWDLGYIFGITRYRGINKYNRRVLEEKVFKGSRDLFLNFWADIAEVKAKNGGLSPGEAIRKIDAFHHEIFEGRGQPESKFGSVLHLARIMQRNLKPLMMDDSYYVMFGGSFPNGKAHREDSDIDAFISTSLFHIHNAVREKIQNADVEVKSFLKRENKVISFDFVHLNKGLPGTPLMNYNPIVILIYADRIEIALYDLKTDQQLKIPIKN